MKKSNNMLSRRAFVAGTAGAAAVAAAPGFIRSASAATPFKMATVFALSGPASLFGPTQTACAKLAVSQINAKGGILGRQVEIVPLDGGAPPADAAKAVLRAVLRDKVELIVGSHDSAVREAIVATLKGKVPYVYTPLYEGGECAPNTYVTADTPQQQVEPSIKALAKMTGAKTYYLIGNDYVWPHKTNDQAKKYIAETGGKVVGEEYLPLGAPNKFEDAVARIKSAKPDMVVITLVGGDNVNFNRTFAGFGLDKSIKRVAYLLEELTLQGIGAKNSGGLYQLHVLFRRLEEPYQRRVQGRLQEDVRRQGAAAEHARRRRLFGHQLRRGADQQGRQDRPGQADGGVERARVPDRDRHGDDDPPPRRQGHVPGRVQGHDLRHPQDLQGGRTRPDLQLTA